MVWEKHHGKVPTGHVITFLDGNKTNFELSNLCLISDAENAVLNFTRLRCASSELMETGIAIAKLKLKIGAITREKKNEQN
jgi:lactam utilization protein B